MLPARRPAVFHASTTPSPDTSLSATSPGPGVSLGLLQAIVNRTQKRSGKRIGIIFSLSVRVGNWNLPA